MDGDIRATRHGASIRHDQYRDLLPIWAVFDNTTTDYPGKWIARLSTSLPKPKITNIVIVADTLEGLRDILPPGLTRLNPMAGDHPKIIETWM